MTFATRKQFSFMYFLVNQYHKFIKMITKDIFKNLLNKNYLKILTLTTKFYRVTVKILLQQHKIHIVCLGTKLIGHSAALGFHR